MTKLASFDLRQSIPQEEFDYVMLSSVLSDYAAPRQKINQLLKSQTIRRVKKGLYVFGERYNNQAVCSELLANLIYGPSCISLESALSYHGLIPEQVFEQTSVTPKRNRNFSTCLGKFSYHHLRPDLYPLGIEQVWIDSSHPVLMATREKALCDYMTLRFKGTLGNQKTARQFLEHDLRIEPNLWNKLNPKTLRLLNQVYANENIEWLAQAL